MADFELDLFDCFSACYIEKVDCSNYLKEDDGKGNEIFFKFNFLDYFTLWNECFIILSWLTSGS